MGEFVSIFQWVIGLAVGVLMPIVAWVAFRTHNLTVEMAVMKARPQVDPIEYTKAVMELASAIAQLTNQLAANDLHRTEQIANLRQQYEDLRQEIAKLRNSIEELGESNELAASTPRGR